MALAAVAFAKAKNRRQMMACTTSIGPGAMNMLTAAGVAHVNRLPVLFLPGDVFANRRPDPVLQQIEDFNDATIGVTDCFRPVSRWWDRITRPEQLLTSLPRAMQVLTDPVECGPVTLAMCQDVQAEAFDYPESFFAPQVRTTLRRPGADPDELARVVDAAAPGRAAADRRRRRRAVSARPRPTLDGLRRAGTASRSPRPRPARAPSPGIIPQAVGSIGVTGSSAANTLAREADVILGVGTRLQDFTTGSPRAAAGRGDAGPAQHPRLRLRQARRGAAGRRRQADAGGPDRGARRATPPPRPGRRAPRRWWPSGTPRSIRPPPPSNLELPTDAQVVGAVNRAAGDDGVVVCAAGGLPGELHKLWRARKPNGYHMEYGFSCMGYEIAGGLGVKMALPEREVFVMVGDGSYMMLNSELQTSVMLGRKLDRRRARQPGLWLHQPAAGAPAAAPASTT